MTSPTPPRAALGRSRTPGKLSSYSWKPRRAPRALGRPQDRPAGRGVTVTVPRTLPREERALLAPWNVGDGVPKDRAESARWFRAAADQVPGDSTATLFLAHQDG